MLLSTLFQRCLRVPYRQVEEGGSFAIQRKRGEPVLFFERSSGQEDWKNNLDFPALPYKRMGQVVWYAHRGFLRVWKAVEPYLREVIFDPAIENAVVAGYSHGAALAVFCHEYIWFHRPDLRGALSGVGYGCPRVIHGLLPRDLNDRWAEFTVVRNLDDAVTHLPPAILGYRHVGALLEIGAYGRYSAIDAHREENILKELRRYEAHKGI